MSVNWMMLAKRLVLTCALALTVLGPIDYAIVRDTEDQKSEQQPSPAPYKRPSTQVNWNS